MSENIQKWYTQCDRMGIRKGDLLFVHSSIKSVGKDARAQDLIAALCQAVGKTGTLLFPTFTSRKEDVFDPTKTPSVMGAVAETFRAMDGVKRSSHPRHPVAALGPMAEKLLADHEYAIGPCGAGTPFEKHAENDGIILMIGVDLDTLTLLHTAEAYLDLAYLQKMNGKYVDQSGSVHTVNMRQVPGGHRGGVRSFEKLFKERGLITYGQIGEARTMLMRAKPVLEAMVALLRKDPMAALCQNEACPDCERFKAKVRAEALQTLGAKLSLILPEEPQNGVAFSQMLRSFSESPIDYMTKDRFLVRYLQKGESTPSDGDRSHLLCPHPHDTSRYESVPAGYKGLLLDPLQHTKHGVNPFYDRLYKGRWRDAVTDILVKDGLSQTALSGDRPLLYLGLRDDGKPVALGEGHAQLREIVSAMRMRNFGGTYHIFVPPGNVFLNAWNKLHEFYSLIP